MVQLILSEESGLWRGFRAPRPANLSGTLGLVTGEATDMEIYEAGAWANERNALVPETPAASYQVTVTTAFEAGSLVTFGFGSDTTTFPVALLRASTVEASLNSLGDMATAGGVDVRPLTNEPGKIEFEVTFREVGARDPITMTGQAGQVFTISELTAGDGSTKEVQKLTIEQKATATISTATTGAAASISNPESGLWVVTLDQRATSGQWKLTFDSPSATTAGLEVDATAQEVKDAILAADDGTGWTVTGDARSGFAIAANEASPPAVTISDTFQGWTGRAGAIDLSEQIEAARVSKADLEMTITKPTDTGRRAVLARHSFKAL